MHMTFIIAFSSAGQTFGRGTVCVSCPFSLIHLYPQKVDVLSEQLPHISCITNYFCHYLSTASSTLGLSQLYVSSIFHMLQHFKRRP